MGKTLFLENARKLRYEAGWVAVHRDGDPRPVLLRADELDCIVVDGKAAFISTYLLDELAARGCSVIFTDSRHMPASILMPLTAATIDTNGKVLSQMSWGAWPRKMLWKRIIECKLENQASVLEGSGHDLEAELLASYAGEVRAGDSTGREAAISKRCSATVSCGYRTRMQPIAPSIMVIPSCSRIQRAGSRRRATSTRWESTTTQRRTPTTSPATSWSRSGPWSIGKSSWSAPAISRLL